MDAVCGSLNGSRVVPTGETDFRLEDGQILGPDGDTGFRIEDNRIVGPEAQPPWGA